MAKKETPHLDEWVKTFKSAAKFTGKVGAGVLQSVAPNISNSISSASDMARDARDIMYKTKTQITNTKRMLDNTVAGRNAMDVIRGAYSDIQNGSFSLDRLGDSAFNMADDFNYDLDNAAEGESSANNTAILGRVVAEGNAASIEGMKQMTTTLSNVQIKTSKASTARIENVLLTNTAQITAHLINVERKIDVTNANMSAIVKYQNTVQLETNRAAVEYYNTSTQLLNKIGEAASAIWDIQKQMLETQEKMSQTAPNRRLRSNVYDTSNGFDYSNYKDFVKKNFENTMAGSLLGIGKTFGGIGLSMGSMGGMADINPAAAMASFVISSLLPKSIKNSSKRFDKTFTQSLDNILYRIGDLGDSGDFIKSTIGNTFGKKRQGFASARMGNFKKDSMSWNGIAQKTLVEVIPSYLARIEAAVSNSKARYYNMDTGKFMTEKQMKNSFRDKFQDTVEFSMSDFTKKLNKNFSDRRIGGQDKEELEKKLNEFVYKQILEKSPTNFKEDTQALRSMLSEAGVTGNDLRNLMMEYSDTIKRARENVDRLNKSIENELDGSVFRNMFNTTGKSTDYLYEHGNIFVGHEFLKSGVRKDRASEAAIKADQAQKNTEHVKKKMRDKAKDYLKKFGPKKIINNLFTPENEDDLSSNEFIDDLANWMYDMTIGGKPFSTGDGFVMRDSTSIDRGKGKVNEEFYKLKSKFAKNNASDGNPYALSIKNQEEESPTELAIIKTAEATEESVKELSNLNNGLFGKEGFISNFWKNTKLQKGLNWLKDKLFNEKDGLFAPMVSMFKDGMDYVKHVFTGKGYTNRKGQTIKDDNNNVVSHLKNGYDVIFSNTMKYVFGTNFRENETYNKYFKWMDWKGRSTGSVSSGKQSSKPKLLAIEDKSMKQLPAVYGEDENTTAIKIAKGMKRDALKALHPDQHIGNEEEFEKKAAEATAHWDKIIKSLENAANTVAAIGGDGSETLSIEDKQKKVNESLGSRIKKHMPKDIAAAIAGAGVGTSLGLHGTGVIGSLFLPGGPIGGALLGLGISIASRSKGIKEFIFGKENEDGVKTGGLISDKMQQFMKKNAPMIIGAGALGALKNIIFGSGALANSGAGVIVNSLLPGGPIGAAILGTSIALLKNNEKFQDILFGKKNEEGKRTGTFAKAMGSTKKIFEKSGNFIKGGLKGLGIGALSGAVIGKAGILGAALTPGGPVGMGLVGLGLGIASQTERFKDLLFGTSEFDTEGNLKGRAKDGLLYRIRNMLVLNVFEPIKDNIQEKVEDFGFWLKDNITYPFRLVFGPIVDSLKGIKHNIEDVVHDAFENVAQTVGNVLSGAVKKIFSPFTSIFGKIGKALINTVSFGAKLALSPVSVPLKTLQLLTMGKRLPEYLNTQKVLFENMGSVITGSKEEWAKGDPKYRGIRGIFNKASDLREGFRTARDSYNEAMGEQGFNSFNWRGVRQDKKDDRQTKKVMRDDRKVWSNINALRVQINKESKGADVHYTDEEFEKVQNQFAKMGVDKKWISTQSDLNLLLHDREAWKDKFLKGENGDTAYLNKHGIRVQETREQERARIKTEDYQDKVNSKLDIIVQTFTKLGMQEALKRKNKVSMKDLDDINAQLKEHGLSWKDMGVNAGDIIDITQISEEDYNEFLADRDINPKDKSKRKKYKGFNDFFNKKFIDPVFAKKEEEAVIEPDATESEEESQSLDWAGVRKKEQRDRVKTRLKNKLDFFSEKAKGGIDRLASVIAKQSEHLDAIKQNTDVSANVSITEAVENTGTASPSLLKRFTGLKGNHRIIKSGAFSKITSAFSSIFRKNKEAAESEHARGLAGAEDTVNGNEVEVVNGEVVEKGSSSVGGFISKIFGTLGSWLSNRSLWTKLGIGLAISGLFGKQIVSGFDFLREKYDKYLKPKLEEGAAKLKTWFEDEAIPKVQTALGTIGDWWTENKSKVIEDTTNFIIGNMNPIIDTTLEIAGASAKIIGSALGNIGKRFANWVAKEWLPFDWVPFPEVYDTEEEKYGKTYNSINSAIRANNGSETGIVFDEASGKYIVLDEDVNKDSEGNYYHVKNPGMQETATRAAATYITQKGTRGKVNRAVRGTIKTVGSIFSRSKKAPISAAGHVIKSTASIGEEKVAKESTEAIIKKAATEAAEKAVKEVSEKATKEAIVDTSKVVAKIGIDAAGNRVVLMTDNAIKKATNVVPFNTSKAILNTMTDDVAKETVEKVAKETGNAVIATATKTISEEVGEKIAKESTEAVVKANAKTLAKTNRSKILKLLDTAVGKLTGVAGKLTKYIPEKSWVSTIKKFCDTAIKGVKSMGDDALNRLGVVVSKKTAEASVDTATSATVIVQALFTAYDLTSGLFEAANLFDIDDKYVTAGMRVVSSLLKAVFGLGILSWIDLVFEIVKCITGKDPKKLLATALYKVFADSDAEEALDRAQVAMAIEVDKYNAANNTNLNVDTYTDLSNPKWYKRFANFVTGKSVDYSQYKATDAEINAYIGNANTSSTNRSSSSGSFGIGYGNGMRSRAVGYGLTQNDRRWANFPIGTFPDGSTSTMATGGCGPTVMSMLASSFGSNRSPLAMAQYAKANGYITDGGANARFFTEGADRLGMRSKVESASSVQNALANGRPVVVSGKSTKSGSLYTKNGHILLLSSYNPSTGMAVVNDPMSPNAKVVNINDLKSGMTNAYSYAVGYGPTILSSSLTKSNAPADILGLMPGNKAMTTTDISKLLLTRPNAVASDAYDESADTIAASTKNLPKEYSDLMKLVRANPNNTTLKNTINEYIKTHLVLSDKGRNEYLDKIYALANMSNPWRSSSTSAANITDLSYSDSGYVGDTGNGTILVPKFKSVASETGLSKLTALLGNFASVGTNLLNSLFGGEKYVSIMTPTEAMNYSDAAYLSTTDGTNTSQFTTSESRSDGKYVPPGYGGIHTYMGWQCITSKSSKQYKLREAAESYDNNGMGRVGDRYAVAMKPYYGAVGDYLNIVQADGTAYKVAIADIKANENAGQAYSDYVHGDGSLVEFVVDKNSWYSKAKGGKANQMHANPGTASFMPELGKEIVSITNVGNYWTGDHNRGYSTTSITQTSNNAIANKVLQIARAEVGTYDGGNNRVKYNNEYYGREVYGSSYPWCCVFLWWVFRHAGVSNLFYDGGQTASCATLLQWFKNKNQFYSSNGKPGDIIFFKFGNSRASDHVGIVVSNNGNGTYTTIEGNSGDYVKCQTRSTNIVGFGRPSYNAIISDSYNKSILADEIKSNPITINPFNILNPITSSLGFGNGPVTDLVNSLGGRVSSGYGYRNGALGSGYHNGIDIAANFGQNIFSPVDGVVVDTGNDVAGYGNYTVIRDRNGNNHLFGHMNRPVGYGVGSRIYRNDIIGEVGSSGNSTGSHLHYEIRKNGSKYSTIDPSKYNINKVNSKSMKDSYEPIGNGNTDLSSKAIRDKLDIALNAEGVENKLDTLIDVMKTWAERDLAKEKSNNQNITNTTNNMSISYGNGQTKVKNNSSSKKAQSIDTTLATIHQAIAAR